MRPCVMMARTFRVVRCARLPGRRHHRRARGPLRREEGFVPTSAPAPVETMPTGAELDYLWERLADATEAEPGALTRSVRISFRASEILFLIRSYGNLEY